MATLPPPPVLTPEKPPIGRPLAFFSQYILPFVIAGVVVAGVWRVASGPLSASVWGSNQILAVSPSPKLKFKARQGETVLTDFRVRNITDRPVRIMGASSSCGCTVVTSSFPINLDPGSTVKISVRMTVGAPSANGKFEKTSRLLIDRNAYVPDLDLEATVY